MKNKGEKFPALHAGIGSEKPSLNLTLSISGLDNTGGNGGKIWFCKSFHT
jgi:hypothetical protein